MHSHISRVQQHRRPALVGRSRERVFLREAMVDAFAGRGQLVLVGGEAGIGKTTLVRDLLLASEADAALKLTGQCYDLTNTPPYGPWLDLFAGYEPVDGLPEPPTAFAGGRLDEISDQAELYADLRGFLSELAARKPVLLMLEDLHWADPASLELLRHFSSRIGSSRILLLLTYRVDELTRTNSFYQQLPTLIRESQGLRLDLRGLSAEELRLLVQSRWQLEPSDEERLVHYLVQHADGNPFFATEMLRGLEEEELVGSTEAGDVVAGLDQLVVPSLLRQVIENRIDRLGEDARSRLAVASVIGQDISLDLWAGVAGMDDEATLDLVDRAVRAHVLEAGRSGTHVTFVHALTRAALYESILPPRRRAWHRQVADVLIERGGMDPDAIAYHLVQAGDERAPEWLIAAGDRAQRAYAWLTATERFTEAAKALQDVQGAGRTRGWLLYRLARLQRYRGGAPALDAFAEAERIGKQIGDPLLETDSQYSRGVYLCFSGDFLQGVEQIAVGIGRMEEQLDTITVGNEDRIPWMADSLPAVRELTFEGRHPAIDVLRSLGIHHRRGGLPWFLALAGRFGEAAEMAESFIEAVNVSPTLGNWVQSASGHAYQGLAIAEAFMGNPDKARDAFERCREVYRPLSHHAVEAFSLLSELRDHAIPYNACDVARRRRLAAGASAVLVRAGGTFPEGLSPERAALTLHVLEGNWEIARRIAEDVPVHGTVILRREVSTSISAIARAQGKLDESWNLIDQVLPQGPMTQPGSTLFPETTDLQMIAVNLALDMSDLERARAWLEAHDRWMAWSGAVLGRADGLLGWSRYFLVAGVQDQAMTTIQQTIEAAREPEQRLVLLAANRLRGELETTLDRVDDALSHLGEALAWAISCELPYEEALTRAALAELHRARHEPDQMHAQVELAWAIAERLGAQPLLRRLAAITTASPEPVQPNLRGLTPRELEVLRLVAQGMTDAAVGEALFISPRTVSQHLRSIYGKLEVSSRAAATRYVIEHGLE